MDKEFLKFLRDKTGQGFDFTRQIPNLAFSALTRVPFLGTALGIGSMFQQTPEQENFMKNIYSDEEYQNLLSQIPGLGNLNPVYMLGSGRGLSGAIDKRLATINRTRKRNEGILSDTLQRREEKLKALRDLERQKEAEFQQQRAREIQQQNKQNRRGGYQYGTQGGGGGAGGDFMEGSGRARDMGSFKDGGLTSLLFRRG